MVVRLVKFPREINLFSFAFKRFFLTRIRTYRCRSESIRGVPFPFALPAHMNPLRFKNSVLLSPHIVKMWHGVKREARNGVVHYRLVRPRLF